MVFSEWQNAKLYSGWVQPKRISLRQKVILIGETHNGDRVDLSDFCESFRFSIHENDVLFLLTVATSRKNNAGSERTNLSYVGMYNFFFYYFV